jgi:HSP20 family protein
VSVDDINVDVHDGRLIVTGEKRTSRAEEGKSYYLSERAYGKFQRVFRLPSDADEGKISATIKDGVLYIKIAKAALEKKGAQSIPINRV